MKSSAVPILLSLVAAFCGAAANYFYKKASEKITEVPIWQNWHLFLGLFLFVSVLVLFITAFRLGGSLLLVYSCYATTYIWSLFFASKFENSSLFVTHYVGVLFILSGIILINWRTAP